MKYCISIDWLQCFGYLTTESPNEGYFQNSMFGYKYKFEKQEYSGRIYAQKYKVYDSADNYIYDLYCEPRSNVLKRNSCAIRCSNAECYNHNLFDDLRVFCSDVGFVFKNFTRIDICHDANMFAGGISGDTLIRRFLSGKIRLTRRLKFTVMGDNCGDMYSGIKIDYLKKLTNKTTEVSEDYQLQGVRWGSRKSAVGIKIYNKTQEMLDVKIKPYIIDLWKESGLNIDKTVWRTEISLNHDSMKWLSDETGELIDLNVNTERLTKQIESTFFSICNKYLHFHNVEDEQTRVDRMPDYPIFSDIAQGTERIRRFREDTVTKSNRMDKYVTKRLIEETNDFKSYSAGERRMINRVVNMFAKKYRLADKHKEGNIEVSDLRDFVYREVATEEETIMKLNRWTYELARQKQIFFEKKYSSEVGSDWNIPLIRSGDFDRRPKTSVQ